MPTPDADLHRKPAHSVLVVEDEALLGRYLASQLALFDYRATVIQDLSNLAQAIADHRPMALIMDIVFPEGDLAGAQILRSLREQSVALPPAVFLSGRSDFDARLAAIRAGGVAYFTKPVAVPQLVDCLNGFLPGNEDEPVRVLIIDDSPAIGAYHQMILAKAGMQVRLIGNPRNIFEAFSDFDAEIVLIDFYMAQCTGPEVAGILRQQSRFVGLPIVFLAAETAPSEAFNAMAFGGDDLLHKHTPPDELVTAVRHRALRHRDMRHFMTCDSLTGLLNHTTLEQRLEQESARAMRTHLPLSFAMVDVDHFKSVNDRHGHPAGDQVLRTLANVLNQRLRRTDIVGRYGGEEFALILPDTPLAQARRVIDDLRSIFSMVKHRADIAEFSCTFSAGVAELDPRGARELLEVADRALYEAKRQGRNRVVCVDELA